MKKIIMLSFASFMVMNSLANAFTCNYKDHFRLNSASNRNLKIASVATDFDLIIQLFGTDFTIKDSVRCRGGYAYITIVDEALNYCNLMISDGPYMSHPVIQASKCEGMRYLQTKYDGFGSYSYTIHLD